MNKYIKEQLQKTNIALPTWDDSTTHMIISRGGAVDAPQQSTGLTPGEIYTIKLESYITNPPPGYTLAANWNNGSNPPEAYLRVEVGNVVGKMVYVNAVGRDSNQRWEGWLPRKGFTIVN